MKQKNKLIERFERNAENFKSKHEKALKQIKVNRRAVEGYLPDSDEKVRVNLILSTLQSLLPHLFAKQPEPSVKPAEKVNPIDGDQGDPVYGEAERFSETARILLKRVMLKAGLKRKARRAVRSAATSKQGVIKVSYRTDKEDDPIVKGEIDTQNKQLLSIQSQISGFKEDSNEYKTLQSSIESGRYEGIEGNDERADEIQLILQSIKSLKKGVKKVTAQGVDLDVIPFDQFIFDTSVSAEEMHEGEFCAHYIFKSVDDVKSDFSVEEDTEEPENCRIKKWAKFQSNEVDSKHENQITSKKDKDEGQKYVKLWEFWHKPSASVYTYVEGDYDFIREPFQPKMMGDLWFPFFILGLNYVDGQDLSLSVVEELIKLMQQYEDTTTDKEEHRKAAIPFMMVDKGKVNADQLSADMRTVGSRDVMLLETNGNDLRNMFAAGPSVPLNERLYDTQGILFEIQNISGVGDAERGAVSRAKTLGEAQIVQRGLATRTDDATSAVEQWLSDIFSYTLAICLRSMPQSEVVKLVGDNAFWPSMDETQDDFYMLVDVEIEAGSSGKPNKDIDQKTWFENLELTMSSVDRIMAMRNQGIEDSENPIYRMFEVTLKRLDERFDIAKIIPKGEVITSTAVVQSIQHQLEQLAQQNPELAQVGAQLIQQNPLISKVIQKGQQNEEVPQIQ